MNEPLQKWLKVSLFSLLLVASAGVVLRYKIAFSLPWVDQKYLLHGHSHFAFAGWVTQALMTLLVQYLREMGRINAFARYRPLLYANMFTAYGMLVSFPLQGYGTVSIIFSTLSIFVSYTFAVFYIRDLNRLPVKNSTASWFKAAVFFNALSSLGAFSLAFMIATKQTSDHFYLSAIYFFLHFQYNGWFFFACAGLLNGWLIAAGVENNKLKNLFRIFFFACIPAYLLSVLWLPLPVWVYWIVVVAALSQVYAWAQLVLLVKKHFIYFKNNLTPFFRVIFLLAAIALSIKLCLQAFSVIPSLSILAFGFRPIVIGYLHLVLLAVVSLFILGCIFSQGYLVLRKTGYNGFIIFVAGIIFNEALLMLQGIGGMWYIAISYADLLLFIAALLLMAGIFLLNIGLNRARYAPAHNLEK